MKKLALTLTAVVTAAIMITSVSVSAWDWSKPFKGPGKDVRSLIITGNYTKHRILAELIQLETKQPILLLPAIPGGKIFFMPARNEALEIEDAKFTNFVKFTKPEMILIIGDGGPVTQSFIDRIDPYQTKIIVYNKNMEQTAIRIGKILDLTDLAYDFSKIEKDLESGKLYKSGSAVSNPGPAMPTPPEASAEPAPLVPVLPQSEPVMVKESEVVPK
ncbi:MAG TPA: hypothetical protein PK821_06160 [Victivallales bacterium]|nr:hypothetical protein [Victivallales bacterium]